MSNQPDLNALFGAAKQDNNLSGGGLQVLNLNDLGTQIQAGLGVKVDDVTSSEVICLVLVVDDSSSIRFVQGNTEAIRDGVNSILGALADTKQSDSIIGYCILMNRGVLYPFSPILDGKKLDQKLQLTPQNYNPSGGTPLYDTVTVALGTAIAKVQEFSNAGVPARAITVVITDGENAGGRKQDPSDVRPLVDDLMRSEMHLVIGMGIADGHTDFKDIFTRMGIRPEWVLTPANDPSSIRKACMMVSQSAVRASQAAAGGFSQVVAGGFGSP